MSVADLEPRRRAHRAEKAHQRLASLFAPDVLEALEDYVEERVAEAVKAAASSEPEWMTVEQAAEKLGCSPNAVRKRARNGRLQSRRSGTRLYLSARSVNELMP